MEINSLYDAKASLEAFINYNKCDKHCEEPHVISCCYRLCMSKNKGSLAYTLENVINGAEYILKYLKKTGEEMAK